MRNYYSLINSMGSGASAIDADAQAFITAAAITDSTQQTAINTLVTDLKGYGIWTKMKAIYPFVGGSASTHKWNLKDPRDLDAAYRLVFYGGGTHSATGWKLNAFNSYAELGSLNMNTISASNYSLGIYLRTNENNSQFYECGATNNVDTGWYAINTKNGAGNLDYQAGTVGFTGLSNASAQGFYQVSATSTTLTKLWKNASLLSTDTRTQSKTPFNQIFNIGRMVITTGGGLYSNREHAFMYLSTALTDTEAVNTRTAVYNYQNALGRLAE